MHTLAKVNKTRVNKITFSRMYMKHKVVGYGVRILVMEKEKKDGEEEGGL